ncbi:MAG: tRNA (adenosine(37)-N6)-threonylcarbamoyltransferase complex dimerization subunit type 1 TsaB [Bacteroidales bacterium]|nr:tRNA (adenosine(37)-N6)-threonylcarbamoyltransferase complex dimerization subunit type 1 TsaB [Bacteroidales bacterium]
MNTLLIETATQICSVVLSADGRILARRDSDVPNAHSTRLSVFIDEVLKESGLTPRDLGAVGVSAGPGSYTGLRIGVSTAKGFCYALGIPLVSVPTLLSMAALYYRQHPDYKGLVCPMIDARRMECYTMVVDDRLRILRDTHADIFDRPHPELQSPIVGFLDEQETVFIGDGAAKTREVFASHANARFDSDFRLSAEGLVDLVAQKIAAGQTEDVAYFEPFYLKDFVAKKSVVHGLREKNENNAQD